MATMQSILDLARLDLNDADKTRNTDANMLAFANDGLAKTVMIRPDLNFGNYTTTFADLTTASTFPLPLAYRPAIANYIVLRCETADDAFAVEERAIQGLKMYLKDLGVG
jgi:hypothetical protein